MPGHRLTVWAVINLDHLAESELQLAGRWRQHRARSESLIKQEDLTDRIHCAGRLGAEFLFPGWLVRQRVAPHSDPLDLPHATHPGQPDRRTEPPAAIYPEVAVAEVRGVPPRVPF